MTTEGGDLAQEEPAGGLTTGGLEEVGREGEAAPC